MRINKGLSVFCVAASVGDLSFLCRQGAVLCDLILLNFLKGAEQYKAKKFEEVSCLLMPLLFRYTNFRVTLTSDHKSFMFVLPGVRSSD